MVSEQRKDAGRVLYAARVFYRLAETAATPQSAEQCREIADCLMKTGGLLALEAISTLAEPGYPDFILWMRDQKDGAAGRHWEKLFDTAAGRAICGEYVAAISEHAINHRRKVIAELRTANAEAMKVIEATPALAAVYKEQKEL